MNTSIQPQSDHELCTQAAKALHAAMQPRIEAASNALAAVDGAFKDLVAYLHGGEPSVAAATMGEADALLRLLDALARDLDAAHAENDRCLDRQSAAKMRVRGVHPRLPAPPLKPVLRGTPPPAPRIPAPPPAPAAPAPAASPLLERVCERAQQLQEARVAAARGHACKDATAQTQGLPLRQGSGELQAALCELLEHHGADRMARVMDEWRAAQGLAPCRVVLEGAYAHEVTRERVFTCPVFAVEDTLWEEGDTAPLVNMKQIEALMHAVAAVLRHRC